MPSCHCLPRVNSPSPLGVSVLSALWADCMAICPAGSCIPTA